MNFNLKADFKPTGDQPQAIKKLISGLENKHKHQVLLGVTGSGKTFTMANVIAKTQKPALVISHNKTLAGQLYQEFRDFFPENAVSYFVSYYDYYQPEAYIPQTDTYIEKETEINELIDKLRLQSTMNILTRNDVVVVASVSCIYNIGSPKEYGQFTLELTPGLKVDRQALLKRLTDLQYERYDFGFHRGTFRVRGENIDIFPAYEDTALRLTTTSQIIDKIEKIDPVNGHVMGKDNRPVIVYPAKHYLTDTSRQRDVFVQIREDLAKCVSDFKRQGKILEAHRLNQRVNFDLEMIEEVGYVNGIENYSRYFDGRKPGDPPYTLLDYFEEAYGDNWLLFIDESHMTIPQINGMYRGDQARKKILIDFGFRLPAAYDNRPLRFEEFLKKIPQTIYTSATPASWELFVSEETVQQLIRPTGLVDPEISIRKADGQIADLTAEIEKRSQKGERVLVTTLTKRMAEELSNYLKEKGIKVHYLHSEIQTLDRSDILDDLRLGTYDCLVGINLLREGLDLPEVSLVAILDADREGFLRSETSLIQTMGRAARHINGQVILYADEITGSIERSVNEINRRRKIQLEHNIKNKIKPKGILKPIRSKLIEREEELEEDLSLAEINTDGLLAPDREKLIKNLTKKMKEAAGELNFELAVKFRDKINEIKGLG